MKKYLKQLPWLLLFYGIFVGSGLIWEQIWRYVIDNTENLERDLNWLSNFNILYYLLLLPLVGAVIVYINTRMQGFFTALSSFDSRGSLLLPIQKLF